MASCGGCHSPSVPWMTSLSPALPPNATWNISTLCSSASMPMNTSSTQRSVHLASHTPSSLDTWWTQMASPPPPPTNGTPFMISPDPSSPTTPALNFWGCWIATVASSYKLFSCSTPASAHVDWTLDLQPPCFQGAILALANVLIISNHSMHSWHT